MRLPAVPLELRPTCADDLKGVDQTFDRPGDPATKAFVRRHCTPCPIAVACLERAMRERHEHGVWGGTTPNVRARRRRAAESS